MLLTLLNRPRRRTRWPLKAAFLAAVVLFTLYPNPALLVRHISRWSDLAAMIQPDEPAIADLVAEVQATIASSPDPRADSHQALQIVQQVVCGRIVYSWDWDNWGCVDYLPTVAEAIERGREDCDGRAVIAASILRKLGYDAQLVTDGSHVWVHTSCGSTMSPMPTASGRTLVRTTQAGSTLDPLALIGVQSLLIDWPKNFAFGVAVFPFGRVMLIAAAAAICLFPVRPSTLRAAAAAVTIAAAVIVWRWACIDPWNNSLLGAWSGIVIAAIGIALAWQRTPGQSDKGAHSLDLVPG